MLHTFRQHLGHWDKFGELLYKLRYPSADVKEKPKLGFNIGALLRVSQYFISLGYVVYMSKSLFKNHKKFMQRLEMFNKFDTFDADDSGRFMDSTGTKYIIYAWFCLKSSKLYLGQTTRGFSTRSDEHRRLLCQVKGNAATKQIPAYATMRRVGLSAWVPIPLLALRSSSSIELQWLEKQCIHRFQPPLNCPFIYRTKVNSHTQTKTWFSKSTSRRQEKWVLPASFHSVKLELHTLKNENYNCITRSKMATLLMALRLSHTSRKWEACLPWTTYMQRRDPTFASKMLRRGSQSFALHLLSND